MKKTVSLILALTMLITSVLSINFAAHAKSIDYITFNTVNDLNVSPQDLYYSGDDIYFNAQLFYAGDSISLIYDDGTSTVYNFIGNINGENWFEGPGGKQTKEVYYWAENPTARGFTVVISFMSYYTWIYYSYEGKGIKSMDFAPVKTRTLKCSDVVYDGDIFDYSDLLDVLDDDEATYSLCVDPFLKGDRITVNYINGSSENYYFYAEDDDGYWFEDENGGEYVYLADYEIFDYDPYEGYCTVEIFFKDVSVFFDYDINGCDHGEYVYNHKAATTKANGYVNCYCTYCFKKVANKSYTVNSIKSASLSAASYTYDGKAKKPAVTVKDSKGKKIDSRFYTVTYSNNKNVGIGKVSIKFKSNYSGTLSKTFTINPKATTVSKVSSPKSKQIKITWGKQTAQVTGYVVQCATDSKFTKGKKTVTVAKNSTTSTTISKLSAKKKYYVRIRTYKTVSGKKYYSAWSKSKTVTTKK